MGSAELGYQRVHLARRRADPGKLSQKNAVRTGVTAEEALRRDHRFARYGAVREAALSSCWRGRRVELLEIDAY